MKIKKYQLPELLEELIQKYGEGNVLVIHETKDWVKISINGNLVTYEYSD